MPLVMDGFWSPGVTEKVAGFEVQNLILNSSIKHS